MYRRSLTESEPLSEIGRIAYRNNLFALRKLDPESSALNSLYSEGHSPTIGDAAKLNAIAPQLYLAEVITKIVNGHPNSEIDALLPWAYPASPILSRVA
jgi:hypothetical protein